MIGHNKSILPVLQKNSITNKISFSLFLISELNFATNIIMSDNEETPKPFLVERAKTGRANCKKCKQKCDVGVLRMAKVGPSPFG